ncbi:ABC transporter ATP-binding protein [Novosphingobium clariflavum]|uniref:ABC transporter ATP-binding protein n=1 Tax=Novosphingobium clariflavum TaxID=2029884 RepID=A0ABV6S6V9_9SPHN|nr:ABC transporter ATP-binding protein [Novosphingobium clariflavum]
MIRLTDVRKVYRTRFGHNVVLDGIGLEMHMGERLGVLGRNGAGKSTMMRLISGAERPTSGRIERTMSVSWPLAFGGAFQTMLTGVDNIRFISRIYDQDFARNLAFVEEFSELGAYLREPVRTYSSGMRARLAFAISMIIEFDCFLIDEIGAVGDARFHDRCNHELFGKRGDRAMVIISHDAAYVRDHCNRFAVLHKGKLAHYDDFDEAYEDFREHIGLSNRKVSVPALPGHGIAPGRSALIEVSQHRALQDDRFRALVMEGDWRRDARAWAEAAGRYAAALALYPYQRSYWVQHGHVSKEQGLFERAEISYRTACALGEPVQDVAEHLAFVMAQQGLDIDAAPPGRYRKGEVAGQAPGQSDIDLFARAVWLCDPAIGIGDGDRARLLRAHATCDALLAAMIGDPRAAAATRGTQGGEAAGEESGEATGGSEEWIRTLCAVAFAPADLPRMVAAAQAITGMEDAWRHLLAAGGFADWPLAQAALQQAALQQAQTPEFKS